VSASRKLQDELSSKPHTFNHGDVKPPNMFMMPGEVPAFIDWQYTAVGKGCQDVVFFLIEGYDVAECRRLEPIVMEAYHAALVHNGVPDYSMEDLWHDWKLACMHFPFYVALWFGTTPDDQLVDPAFPRRFVPRAFDAIIRNDAQELLAAAACPISSPPRSPASSKAAGPGLGIFEPLPDNLNDCQKALLETRAALADACRGRDAYKAALDAIQQTICSVVPSPRAAHEP